MSWVSYTVRLTPRDHELLSGIAYLNGLTLAELTRDIVHDAIPGLLDPAEIVGRLDAERDRLIAEGARLNAEAASQADQVQR